MAVETPVLWQIKPSHYNEKVRWALDYKGVAHRRRAPVPPLFTTIPAAWLMTRGITLPVLRLDGKAIGDSTRIIAALEERYPQPPLYPSDPAQRQRALELEDHFDEQLGPYVRRLVWLETAKDPRSFLASALPGSSSTVIALMRPGAPLSSWIVRRRFGARDGSGRGSADEARGKILAAMELLQAKLGSGDYLVGDAFSVADLTAAALLTPLIQPPGRPYLPGRPFPESLRRFQQELEAMPGGRWVHEMYRRHRGSWVRPEAAAAAA
jgi:glutathione S-transferase